MKGTFPPGSEFPQTLGRRYECIDQIGSGSSGTVFKVRDKTLNSVVAIKVISSRAAPEKILRFQQEAKASGRLNHQNLVKVLDFDRTEDGHVFMVLEYIHGKSLKEIMAEGRDFDPDYSINIFTQIAAGLAHAHANGILHRDLKPANILVSESNQSLPEVKVIDFGLAKVAGQSVLLTTGQIAVGTPAYMSPEQGKAEEVDERSDIYSFGCVLYEFICGQKPFEGESALDVIYKHASHPIPPLSSLNNADGFVEALEPLINTCLEKKREDRFSNFGEIFDALNQIKQRGYEKLKTVDNIPNMQESQAKTKVTISKFVVLVAIVLMVSATFLTFLLFSPEKNVEKKAKAPNKKEIKKIDLQTPMSLLGQEYRVPAKHRNASEYVLAREAKSLLESKDQGGALAYLNLLLEKSPENLQYLKLRARANTDLTNHKAALEDIEKLLKAKPDDFQIELMKAANQRALSKSGEAIDIYSNLLKKYPGNIFILQIRAADYYNFKHYKEAIADCTEILKQKPNHYRALKFRALSYKEIGEFEKALADLNNVEGGGKTENVILHKARIYMDLNQYEKALAETNKVILDKNFSNSQADAYKLRIKIYKHLGQYQKAEQDKTVLYGLN